MIEETGKKKHSGLDYQGYSIGGAFLLLALFFGILYVYLTDIADKHTKGHSGVQALVVADTGSILAASGTGMVRNVAPGAAIPDSLQQILRAKSEQAALLDIDGTDCYALVANVGETALNLLLLTPLSHGLAVRDILRIVLPVSWLVMCLLGILFIRQHRKYYHYKSLSERDRLTDTGNRLAFENTLRDLRANPKFPVCLLFMDMDGLKQINDSLGHEAGDALLRSLSTLLRRFLRDSDSVCRIGGDEFAVILPGTSLEHARTLAERVRAKAAETHTDSILPPLYYSYGLAEAVDLPSLATLPQRADAAMYADKNVRRETTPHAIRLWLKNNRVPSDRRSAS